MDKTRCAVIGVGRLGGWHADKYASHPDCELVAVVDTDPETAARVADRLGTRALTDHRELLGRVDAVSIAVPTQAHHRVAGDFLRADTHVLLEKPITVSVDQADELVALAEQHQRVLAIGHLERFNVALMELDLTSVQPRYITADRLAPFVSRGADVDVVRDLMIHDIDIVLDLVKSEVVQMDALGGSVLTDDIDIANARLKFRNGCVANITASRISMKPERKMRMFLADSYVSIDFLNHHARRARAERKNAGDVPEIHSEEWSFEKGDALRTEIAHFVRCVRDGEEPLVSGRVGRQALQVAIEISRLVHDNPMAVRA